MLEPFGYEVIHFVEPQDLDAYSHMRKLICIEKNDQGISYARNYVLRWAKSNDIGKYWIIDDDILGFYKYVKGKTIKSDASILAEVESRTANLGFELIGLNHRSEMWRCAPYNVNSKYVYNVVLIDSKNVTWEYDDQVYMKEDRDFSLSAIKYGKKGIIRMNHFGFEMPVMGSNKGGLYEQYRQRLDTVHAKRMVLKWSPYCTLYERTGKNNRIDGGVGSRTEFKVDIRSFAKAHGKQVV